MARRPWIVDSAPELALTRPSVSTPSNVAPVDGSYVARPLMFAPKNQPPARPARVRKPADEVRSAAASRPETRPSAP